MASMGSNLGEEEHNLIVLHFSDGVKSSPLSGNRSRHPNNIGIYGKVLEFEIRDKIPAL